MYPVIEGKSSATRTTNLSGIQSPKKLRSHFRDAHRSQKDEILRQWPSSDSSAAHSRTRRRRGLAPAIAVYYLCLFSL